MKGKMRLMILVSFIVGGLFSAGSYSQNVNNSESSSVSGIDGVDFLSDIEKDVMKEMNLARTNPAEYAAKLKEFRKRYRGNLIIVPDGINMMTNEGVRACDEAIRFLETSKPLAPLKVSKGLSLAARDHAKDQGPKGATGHDGSNGSSPFARMNHYGKWLGSAGENISYGKNTGEEIVFQLLIDDGVQSRGHRKNIFSSAFNFAGIGFGSHRKYNYMCVIDFAGGYAEK
jgi:uncharacterized protein YkwD